MQPLAQKTEQHQGQEGQNVLEGCKEGEEKRSHSAEEEKGIKQMEGAGEKGPRCVRSSRSLPCVMDGVTLYTSRREATRYLP